MQWAVDGDDIGLGEHLLEALNSSATNFLGSFRGEGLVIEVEEFLAVEGHETSQDTFTDTSNTNGGNNFAFNIERVLGDGSNVPFTTGNHLVGRNKVADKSEHGENDVLGNGLDVGSGDFGNEDVVLIGGGQVDMVGTLRISQSATGVEGEESYQHRQ